MSGALPARSAAMILSSLMPPTTLMLTFGCAFWYSAISFLNEISSVPALQPTQIVSGVTAVRLPDCVGLAEANEALTASAANSPIAAATRFITALLVESTQNC